MINPTFRRPLLAALLAVAAANLLAATNLTPHTVPADSAAASPQVALSEVTVVSRLEAPVVESTQLGARKISASQIKATPSLMGEADVLKALTLEPGIAAGAEGMAEMHVHGGNAYENLFLLDNVPLYQVNHFGGLFSAFNLDALSYIDFYKSSIPAKYDGRLSSVLDARTRSASSTPGHHGSLKLGITSGALSIAGPIARRTSYMVAVRRSWFDLYTIPLLHFTNADNPDKTRFQYFFTDVNAKITHRFSPRATAFASLYFGDDLLKSGETTTGSNPALRSEWTTTDHYDTHWGNLVALTGLTLRLSPAHQAEFTAAYTEFFSSMKQLYTNRLTEDNIKTTLTSTTSTRNRIHDIIAKADFSLAHSPLSRLRYGTSATLHTFLPPASTRTLISPHANAQFTDSTSTYLAGELKLYAEEEVALSPRLSLNAGLHASLFRIDGRTRHGLSPRLSVNFRPHPDVALKGAFTRTVQFVHQVSHTYFSLPTDQWVPVAGNFKPQTANKLALGAYWQPASRSVTLSLEGYLKRMNNLVEYRSEYYLALPTDPWDRTLCTGRGSARGIDFKAERTTGTLTGHVAYSLAWADRTFPLKNGGATFPARFDNRHTINLLLNWHITRRLDIGAAWTGHTGNRYTLLTQMWQQPSFTDPDNDYEPDSPLRAPLNAYTLPFYHRLDLSLTLHCRRGFWNFALYNAYNHLNTVAIQRTTTFTTGAPVFRKVKLLPIIPSLSYTWQF